ncbi:MAG TPA: BMC domain-containing protein [Ignavibacteriaceae bacterium]
MSNSIGLIESKGIVALLEAADVILKNSPVKILGIHKLENGLVSLAVIGNSDYVKAAIESGTEAGRRVGEIYASSVVENPGKEILEIFSELFPSDEISKNLPDEAASLKSYSGEKNIEETSNVFASVTKQIKNESKREKSKPLQVTKVTPIQKNKKVKDKTDHNDNTKLNESLENNAEDIEINNDDIDLTPESVKRLSTIERLRIEALGLESKKKDADEIILPAKIKNDVEKKVKQTFKNSDVDFEAIDKMNVHKLRHYARAFPDFPIKGREISRANRDELVEWFRTMKND